MAMQKRVYIEAAEPSSDREWDDFVRDASNGTFCHLYGWRAVMADVLGHECHYLMARGRDGGLRGVLPLVRVRSRLFGDYLMSMPFLNYGGPLGDAEAVNVLIDEAKALAGRMGVDLLELRSRVRLPGSLQVSSRKIHVLLDLPGEAETLWKAFPSKLRTKIRRPTKEGMELRVGAGEAMSFYEVFSHHMRDLGTPVLPSSFFQGCLDVFDNEVVYAAVYRGDQPVAVGAGFVFGSEFEITWSSALRAYSPSNANMLLYWGLMEEMIRRRLKTFNFGRCTPDSGNHGFKKQWGGRDVPLPWAQWSANDVAGTPSPESAKYKMATRVWQKLPLAVTNRLGPVLARCIP